MEKDTRKLEASLIRIMNYAKRLAGTSDLAGVLDILGKILVAARTAQLAVSALAVAAGPVGWLYAGTSMVAAGLSGYAVIESMSGYA